MLDRHDEAIQNEWPHFTQVPAICSYQALMELVPETARATWYDRAIEAAVQPGASLSALLPLLAGTEETARLACVTGQCTDDHLSRTGYRTAQAAEALDESYPEQAARLWRALGLGIVNTGKSKQYSAAVEYFGRAKRCFAVAGLLDCWDQLAGQVRANHYRKAGFIREFEKVVTGVTPGPEPGFPGKARAAGLRRNDFPQVAPNAACRGAGIRDHGGMPDDELLERVRELRARGWSPKEIARALKVPPATVTPLIRRLGAAEPQEKEAPLTGCWVNQGWSSSVRFTGHPEWPDTGPGETGESGLVIVVVARERGSSVRVCEFLVDTWCLGVKNALGPKPAERRKLPSFCADAFRSYPGAPVEVPLVLAQRIVFGAVGYARGLGFEPHADFAKAAGHLGERDGVRDLEFGRDGMPMYIEGPHDDTWRIMHTLRQNVGDGNFHYLAGLRS